MKVRRIKAKFHGLFYVNYKEREISVGPGVRNGRLLQAKRYFPTWGSYWDGRRPPVLPQ